MTELYMNKPANYRIAPRITGYAGDPMDIPTFLAIAKEDIPKWAAQYVDYLDTSPTQEVCKCEWIVNEDDLNIRPMHCRNCKHPREKHLVANGGACSVPFKNDPSDFYPDLKAGDECPCAGYVGRRVRVGEQDPQCPVHTSIGRVMGFFEFVFNQQPEPIKPSQGPDISAEEARKLIERFEDKYIKDRRLSTKPMPELTTEQKVIAPDGGQGSIPEYPHIVVHKEESP